MLEFFSTMYFVGLAIMAAYYVGDTIACMITREPIDTVDAGIVISFVLFWPVLVIVMFAYLWYRAD